jgi:hypothetical protein
MQSILTWNIGSICLRRSESVGPQLSYQQGAEGFCYFVVNQNSDTGHSQFSFFRIESSIETLEVRQGICVGSSIETLKVHHGIRIESNVVTSKSSPSFRIQKVRPCVQQLGQRQWVKANKTGKRQRAHCASDKLHNKPHPGVVKLPAK